MEPFAAVYFHLARIMFYDFHALLCGEYVLPFHDASKFSKIPWVPPLYNPTLQAEGGSVDGGPGLVLDLDQEHFDSHLNNAHYLLVMFYAPW